MHDTLRRDPLKPIWGQIGYPNRRRGDLVVAASSTPTRATALDLAGVDRRHPDQIAG